MLGAGLQLLEGGERSKESVQNRIVEIVSSACRLSVYLFICLPLTKFKFKFIYLKGTLHINRHLDRKSVV